MTIAVDDDVREMIEREGCDYRVCTACTGAALVPVRVKAPKETDIVIDVGRQKLYVSAVQARYIDRVTMDMLYDEEDIDSCPAFYMYTRSKDARGGQRCSGSRTTSVRSWRRKGQTTASAWPATVPRWFPWKCLLRSPRTSKCQRVRRLCMSRRARRTR